MRKPADVTEAYTIDCCQYCNWSPKIFQQMREGGVDAVHVTVCYHEDFRETVEEIVDWNRRFEQQTRSRVISPVGCQSSHAFACSGGAGPGCPVACRHMRPSLG